MVGLPDYEISMAGVIRSVDRVVDSGGRGGTPRECLLSGKVIKQSVREMKDVKSSRVNLTHTSTLRVNDTHNAQHSTHSTYQSKRITIDVSMAMIVNFPDLYPQYHDYYQHVLALTPYHKAPHSHELADILLESFEDKDPLARYNDYLAKHVEAVQEIYKPSLHDNIIDRVSYHVDGDTTNNDTTNFIGVTYGYLLGMVATITEPVQVIHRDDEKDHDDDPYDIYSVDQFAHEHNLKRAKFYETN